MVWMDTDVQVVARDRTLILGDGYNAKSLLWLNFIGVHLIFKMVSYTSRDGHHRPLLGETDYGRQGCFE